MSAIAQKQHTVGNRQRWELDYSDWLDTGTQLVSAAIVSSSVTAGVDTITLNDAKTRVIFFTNGGLLNEQFTVTVTATDTRTRIKIDTIDFTVVAP